MLTFTQLQHEKGVRVGLWFSIAAHCVIAYVMMRPVRPIFVTPSYLAFGNHGTDIGVVYLSRQGLKEALSSPAIDEPLVAMSRIQPRKTKPAKKNVVARQQTEQQPRSDSTSTPRAGSPFGSVLGGSLTGHDVRPALPIAWEDPVVPRSTLPDGVEGNVIVEITIDEAGTVTATKVIQGLGYGIEEKVVAAVRNWRFRPATMDGRAIPSQQDVYYHFPT